MKNQCNFAGYIVKEPKVISEKLLGITLLDKQKDKQGNESVTWISITLAIGNAYWLKDLQKGDYITATNCRFQEKEHNGKKYASFFTFEVESPTLQARGQQQKPEQPANGNPANHQGGNDFLEEDVPF